MAAANHVGVAAHSGAPANAPASNTAHVQAQVDDVIGIMQDNVSKVIARGEHLDTIQTKTENLQQSSVQFKQGATQVRRKFWWKDMKMRLIIGGVLAIIIVVIVVSVVKTR